MSDEPLARERQSAYLDDQPCIGCQSRREDCFFMFMLGLTVGIICMFGLT